MGKERIPAVNASASKDSTGAIHISFVYLNPTGAITIHTSLDDTGWSSISGQVLTSAHFNDYNSFEDPDKVKAEPFTGARKEGNGLVVNLPAKSVVVLELK
jgi:alpha-N-arabinofuranosidase